jgi:hypothetical protein
MLRESASRTTFGRGGSWFKGNLHSHSLLSDGRLEPAREIEAYRSHGYDFLALSEHDRYEPVEAGPGSPFLVLPAFEYDFAMEEGDPRAYHLNVFPGPGAPKGEPFEAPRRFEPRPMRGKDYAAVQGFIDEFAAKGCLVMLNHPTWSLEGPEDILPLEGLFAVEIFNYSSELLENLGSSLPAWDAFLRAGKAVWGTATDDNHNCHPLDSPYCDSFGGWVCVKAPALEAGAILEALAAGSFYSSAGPLIHRFELEGDRVHFECSPSDAIYLNADRRQSRAALGAPGRGELTSFEARLDGSERYLRMECVDAAGKKAYTNPVFLD